MTDFAPPAPPVEPEPRPPSRFKVPADYYGSSPDEVRSVFPRWVPIGCGTAAAILLLAVFIAGGVVAHTGMGRVMALLLGTMQEEIGSMYAKDVTPAQKKALQDELSQLRDNLRAEKIPVTRLDPVMKALRESIRDQSISSSEAQRLTAAAHEANTPPPPKRKL